MLFSLLKHFFELYITDTALKVSRSLYCFTASISHGIENCFPRLWGMGISDANFKVLLLDMSVFFATLSKCVYIAGDHYGYSW